MRTTRTRTAAREGGAGRGRAAGVRVHLELVVCVRVVFVVKVVHGDVLLHGPVQQHARLQRPAARHVLLRVAAAACDERRQAEALHEPHALRVPIQAEVEAPQPVRRQRVRAALQHHGARAVHLHHFGDDGLEQLAVRRVIHAVRQRHVQAVVAPVGGAHVLQVARAREKVAVLVERHRHHAVREPERLLHAVAVVDVDVDVQHARVTLRSQAQRVRLGTQ